MQYPVVASRINDVPPPFTRPDTNYASLQVSLALALSDYSLPADSIVSQALYSTSSGGWLNVWGQLLGFPRYPSEADSVYRARVLASLAAPVGSIYAVQTFATSYFGTSITVTENSPGYTIVVPSYATSSQISGFVFALERVRPAGVPVFLYQIFQGFYFNTYNYIGGSGVAGIYFGGNSVYLNWPLSVNTNNSQPLLPSLILTDPIINGLVTL